MSSKVVNTLTEVETRVKSLTVNNVAVNMTGKTILVDDASDLLEKLKGLKSYPAIGVVYEGLVSKPEAGDTAKMGISADMGISLVLVEQGDVPFPTLAPQKTFRAIDYLNAMRDEFMGTKSTVTGHFFKFEAEAAAELTKNMVVWVQRWSVPIQLPPKR